MSVVVPQWCALHVVPGRPCPMVCPGRFCFPLLSFTHPQAAWKCHVWQAVSGAGDISRHANSRCLGKSSDCWSVHTPRQNSAISSEMHQSRDNCDSMGESRDHWSMDTPMRDLTIPRHNLANVQLSNDAATSMLCAALGSQTSNAKGANHFTFRLSSVA